jgi:hypothetical protein
MAATAPITLSIAGDKTGKSYNGKFSVKLVLTRRESFLADERRRMIIGANFAAALPALHEEAWHLGLLSVRLIDAPDWWKQSDGGLDLEDPNVIKELHKLCEEKIAEAEETLREESKAALKKLAKADKAE